VLTSHFNFKQYFKVLSCCRKLPIPSKTDELKQADIFFFKSISINGGALHDIHLEIVRIPPAQVRYNYKEPLAKFFLFPKLRQQIGRNDVEKSLD